MPIKTIYVCDNCDRTTDNDDDLIPLGDCKDLSERLDVGGTVPAGCCPECDCFVYQIDQDQRLRDSGPKLLELLNSLVDWARDHVSPIQPNSPHKILIESVELMKSLDYHPHNCPCESCFVDSFLACHPAD